MEYIGITFAQINVINREIFVQFNVKTKEMFVDFNTNKCYTIDTGYQEGVCLCIEK